MLVSLSRAFDTVGVDDLLFLSSPENLDLVVSGDGVLKFSRLISAGLVTFSRTKGGLFEHPVNSGFFYYLALTPKGEELVAAWKSGNRTAVEEALTPPSNSN